MLSELKLSQFRCFDSLRLEMTAGMTVFIGANAQGKTSILEAICVLLRLQSPRTSVLNELIQFEKGGFGVAGTWRGQDLRVVNEHGQRRRLYHHGNDVSRNRDYLDHSGLVVWMGSDDLGLITGRGSRRRRYLDFLAAQLYPDYGVALRSYEHALRSRNGLLKEGTPPNWPQIDAYTEVLVEHGEKITRQRRELIGVLNPHIRQAQHAISGQEEDLATTYTPGAGENFMEMLERSRQRDLRRGLTTSGPHRDDLRILVNDRPAARFASEGQQRTIALALKLGQMELLQMRRSQTPILLVDDIFGELDPARRQSLTRAFPESGQKLITTTSLDWLPEYRLLEPRVFRVSAGQAEVLSS